LNFEGKKYWFIVNPTAGRNRVRRANDSLRRRLDSIGIDYVFEMTEGPGHATLLARQYGRNGDIVVAVGGDGTVHEVANGLINSQSILGVIPLGSGNDFSRMLHAPKTPEEINGYLTAGTVEEVDTGKVSYKSKKAQGERSFVNGIGIGFDAETSSYSRRVKWLTGLPLYLFSLLRTLPSYTARNFEFNMSGQRENRDCFLIYIGNGAFEGGGFNIIPHANALDGRLDVCFIAPVSFARVLRLFPMVIAGQHGGQQEVEFRSCSKIEISSLSTFSAHVDGEIIGSELEVVAAEVKPHSLHVLVGRNHVR
jgi:diacylglycerol kinase (ATP)